MLVSICSWASLSAPGPCKGSMGSDAEEARQVFSCGFSWILVPYVVTRLLLLGTAEGLLCGVMFLQLTKTVKALDDAGPQATRGGACLVLTRYSVSSPKISADHPLGLRRRLGCITVVMLYDYVQI